jgi:hypothetical protein
VKTSFLLTRRVFLGVAGVGGEEVPSDGVAAIEQPRKSIEMGTNHSEMHRRKKQAFFIPSLARKASSLVLPSLSELRSVNSEPNIEPSSIDSLASDIMTDNHGEG